MLAAANGHATVSAMLGSVPEQSLDIKNNDGHNAIMLAGSGGHAEVVRALFETGRLEAATAVSWGSCIEHSNDLQLTSTPADAGWCPPLQDKVQALHEAVLGRHAAAVHALTTFKVDVNKPTKEGVSPLIVAIRQQDSATASVLVAAGANPNARDLQGRSALMIASTNGSSDTVRLLLAYKAEVNATDNDGNTALILGSKARHLVVNEVLIASGAAVYARDNNGKSALDYVDKEIASAMRVRDEHSAWVLGGSVPHTLALDVVQEKHALLALLAAPKSSSINTSSIPRRCALLLHDPPPEATEEWLGYHYKPLIVSSQNATNALRNARLATGATVRLGAVGGDDAASVHHRSYASILPAPPRAPPPEAVAAGSPHTGANPVPMAPGQRAMHHSESRQTAGEATS